MAIAATSCILTRAVLWPCRPRRQKPSQSKCPCVSGAYRNSSCCSSGLPIWAFPESSRWENFHISSDLSPLSWCWAGRTLPVTFWMWWRTPVGRHLWSSRELYLCRSPPIEAGTAAGAQPGFGGVGWASLCRRGRRAASAALSSWGNGGVCLRGWSRKQLTGLLHCCPHRWHPPKQSLERTHFSLV